MVSHLANVVDGIAASYLKRRIGARNALIEACLLERYHAARSGPTPAPLAAASDRGPANLVDATITVVLNGYRRPHTLAAQLDAIAGQTIAPTTIMFWQNAGATFDRRLTDGLATAECNRNWGVWARFAYALNAQTEFVCVFDDDTIPGRRWFENCVNTMGDVNGLLGTNGIVFLDGRQYSPFVRHGWGAPNPTTRRVDIVGHAWFFRREWLSLFWRELPTVTADCRVGEDIHFSAMLQRFGGIGTYVPPHPPDEPEWWGSQPDLARRVGKDAVSVSLSPDGMTLMNEALAYEVARGFRPICSEMCAPA